MKEQIIIKAYEYLNDVTPLNINCGSFCNSKCCKGNDNDGMLLFPGEKVLFDSNKNFVVYFDDTYNEFAVRCNGQCNRDERPLACRIFPYMIYKNKNSKTTVAPDIRAIGFCPLLDKKYRINKKFLRALRITSKILNDDVEISLFLEKITEILTDFNSLE